MVKRSNEKHNKKRILTRAGTAILSILLVVALVIGLVPKEAVYAAKQSDGDTTTKYTESLGDNTSTEFAGRVWTDKSVWDEASISVEGDNNTTFTITNDSDFLVGFSALATSQSIAGQTQAPIDVVFVIDMSSSMSNTMDDRDTRLENSVEALNAAVEEVLSLNEYSRIGVVSYNSTAYEVLPLDHYEKINNTEFFTFRSSNSIRVSAKGTTTTYTQTVSGSSGTNIHKGIAEGMEMLVSETSTTALINGTEVQRVPSVVILSDGQPSCSSSYSTWWDISADTTSYPVANNNAIHGMRAIMNAAYMKNAIDRNYGKGTDKNITKVYTIGLGIDDLDTDSRNLAYVTLDPNNHLSDNNSMANSMRQAWTTYLSGGNPTLNGVTLTHPDSYDINVENGLNYVDAYYGAQNASDVASVFQDIVQAISLDRAEVPTEHDVMDPFNSGYITYTDPIGEYMEVKSMKSIVYAGQIFEQSSHTTSGTATDYMDTYVFEGTIDGNEVYGNHSLSEVIIEVYTKVTNGIKSQTVVIKIPAGTIPIRINEVQLDSAGNVKSHTNNGTYPIRIFYTVGLQSDAVTKNGYIDTDTLSEEYINKNKNADGTINFYSNLYTGTNVVNNMDAGDATVEFEAAHTNPFYYIQDNTPIYTDQACTIPASSDTELDDTTNYYYLQTYYSGLNVVTDAIVRTGAQLKEVGVAEVNGVWNRPVGSPRINRMMRFQGTKTTNSTNTAATFYVPSFVNSGATAYEGYFKVYLGNNGVMNVAASGNLDIKKTVTVADSALVAPDKEFTFTVDLKTSLGGSLSGTYTYEVLDTSGNPVVDGTGQPVTGTISSGGTLTLKAGQTGRISNLPPNTSYTVTETSVAGFTTTVNNAAGNIAEGSITAGQTAEAAFNNEYSVTELLYPENGIQISKVLTGREATASDSFTFTLTPYDSTYPMPAVREDKGEVLLDSGAIEKVITFADSTTTTTEVPFDFGQIKFTKPGTYVYAIQEVRPTAGQAGLTYSKAVYRIEIVVADDGAGNLVVSETTNNRLLINDQGDIFYTITDTGVVLPDPMTSGESIVFTNTYSEQTVNTQLSALKVYTDNSGVKPLESGMFSFTLEPVGEVENGQVKENTASLVPMPTTGFDAATNTVTVQNNMQVVTFPTITYDNSMLEHINGDSHVYRYKMTEAIPATPVSGMTYDTTPVYVDVTLTWEVIGESGAMHVDVQYLDENYQAVDQASFTNSYTPSPVTVELKGGKTLVGRNSKPDESFSFALSITDNDAFTGDQFRKNMGLDNLVPEPVVVNLKDGVETEFSFGSLEIRKPGTYLFTAEEITTNISSGITADTGAKNITIVVTDVDGQLVADITYDNGTVSEATDRAVFVNIYSTTSINAPVVTGTKTMSGRPLTDGAFFFEIDTLDANENVIETHVIPLTIDKDDPYKGTMNFLSNVVYDTVGIHSYLVREQIPDAVDSSNKLNGVTYDGTEYMITVMVTDADLDGTLEAATILEKVNRGAENTYETVDAITFSNSYTTTSVTPTMYSVTKVLQGDRATALQAGEFDFNITITGDYTGYTIEGFTGTYGNPTQLTVSNTADGKINPVNITYTKPGDYVIEIQEVAPADAVLVDGKYVKDGITYDTHTVKTTLRVTDDGNGNLVATRVGTTTATVFTNTYKTTGILDGATNLVVTKDFTGRENDEWKENLDVFNFELTPYGTLTTQEFGASITMAAGTDKVQIDWADADKQAAFGDITFTKPGTYQFMIREAKPEPDAVPGAIPGVTYDAIPRIVTVEVTDNSDGTMTAAVVSVTTEEGAATDLTFKNVFDNTNDPLNGHNNLHVQKVLQGREWTDTDSFTFKLQAYNDAAKNSQKVEFAGATEIQATLANKDIVHFGNILFKAEGEYQFVITETVPADTKGITYDSTARLITVNAAYVTNTDNSVTLKATLTKVETGTYANGVFTSAGEVADKKLVFTNTYDTEDVTLDGDTYLAVTKELAGRNWTADDAFTFVLETANANAADTSKVTMPDPLTLTITSGDSGYKKAFGDILFKEAGEYQFTIKEQIPTDRAANMSYDTHTETITVTVVDNLEGKLVIDSVVYGYDSTGALTWTNKYTPNAVNVVLEAKKSISGRDWKDGDSFNFLLTPATGVTPMPSSQYATATKAYTSTANNIIFGSITYQAEGTYEYYITEVGTYPGITIDNNGVKAVVTVTNNPATGNYEAEVTYLKRGEVESAASEEPREFINLYTSVGELDGSIYLKVNKSFTGRQDNVWLDTDSFTFALAINDAHEATKTAYEAGQIVLPTSTDLTLDNTNKDTGAFGNIKFTKPGNYQFVITETKGTISGVTYDSKAHVVNVTVTDNLDGTLKAIVTDGSDKITFNNTYGASGTLTEVPVKKVLTGREWRGTDQFTFALEPVHAETIQAVKDGVVTLPANDAVTQTLLDAGTIKFEDYGVGITVTGTDGSTADVDGKFGSITFNKVGTYTFRVREVKPSPVSNAIVGMVYDSVPRTITVTVTDNNDGTLAAAYTVTEGTNLTFTNTYDPQDATLSGHNNLHVIKEFTGRFNDQWLSSDSFQFTLTANPDHQATVDAVNGQDIIMPTGTLTINDDNRSYAHFGDIEFKKIGTYQFLIKETIPTGQVDNGITYDKSVYVLTVDVHEVSVAGTNGVLEAALTTVQKAEDGDMTSLTDVPDKKITFKNTYKAQDAVLDGELNLKVTKEFTGRDWNDTAFTFNLTANEDYGTKVVMAEPTQIVINKDKAGYSDFFGDITFDEIGTYSFTIKENLSTLEDGITADTEPVIVTVDVSDNGKGQLVATPTYSDGNSPLLFKNTYTPAPVNVSLEASKVLTEPDGTPLNLVGGEFTFKVSKPSDAPASVPPVNAAAAEQSNDADGNVVFTNVLTFSAAGTYEYQITEVNGGQAGILYDSGVVTVTVEVTYDSATGLLKAGTPEYKLEDGTQGNTFTNVYESKPATFNLSAKKVVDPVVGNYTMKKGDFEFVIHRVDDAGTPDSYDPVDHDSSHSNDADGNISLFSNVTYEYPGTYTYTVKEVNKQYAGFTYDSAIFEVVVTAAYEKGQLNTTYQIFKVTGNDKTPITDAEFVFKNEYNVDKEGISIGGEKVLTGKPLTDGEFSFTISPVSFTDTNGVTAADTSAMPLPKDDNGQDVTTVTNIGKDFAFPNITFTADMVGTYVYEVKEVKGSASGVSYDDTVYNVTITVETKDMEVDGTVIKDAVAVTVDKTNEDIVFTNNYTPDDVTIGTGTVAGIEGKKTLAGREMTAGEFEFTLTPVSYTDENSNTVTDPNKIPMPASNTTANMGSGSESTFAFGKITYDKTGEYRYTIKEVKGTRGGVAYDEAEYDVIVTVTDIGYDGQLDAAITYYQGGNADVAVVFNNTYTAKDTVLVLEGMKKKLVGREFAAGEFQFTLAPKNYYTDKDSSPVEGAEIPMPAAVTVTNGAHGVHSSISFGEIKYTQTGIYEYVLTEVDNGIPYIDYDDAIHVIQIEVTDNLEGSLVAKVIQPTDGLGNIIFVNEYKTPDVEFVKTQTIDGVPTTARLTLEAGDVITYTMTVTNKGGGTAEDITITDKTPDGLTFVTGSVEGGDSHSMDDTGVITWNIQTLGAGESKSVSFKARIPVVDKDTNWSNVATMSYENNPENPTPDPENPDPDPTPVPSNEVEVETKIPVLGIVKEQKVNAGTSTTEKQEVKAGDIVTYTMKISNTGNSAAKKVTVKDTIPEGLILITETLTSNASVENGVITWVIDSIEPGTTAEVYFQVKVPEGKDGDLWNNIATVTYDKAPGREDDTTPGGTEETPDDSVVTVESNPVTVELKVEAPASPVTGDQMSIILWVGLAVVSCGLATALIASRRRKNR